MLNHLFADKKANVRRTILAILMVGFILFLYFINQVQKPALVTSVGRTFERARVVAVVKDNLQEDGHRYGEQNVRLLMLSGPKKGQTVDSTSAAGYLFGAGCTPGMEVITIQSVSGNISVTSVYSSNREGVVYAFILLFFLILCIIGGKKGIKASIGLIFTFVCILFLYIPLIFRGFSPFWAAVVVAVVTTLVTMYLIGGPTKKTACAIVGTVAGVIIAGVSATGFGFFAGISGYNVSDIENLLFLGDNTKIQVGGLLFSGLLIASLGAVMDIAISIASTINEIHEKEPALSRLELFKSGMSVGRDMMGTMSSTLILAFAGGSISILVTNYVYDLPYVQIINSYGIGIEIMQAISGSMGVILTVPIVAAISAFSMSSVPAVIGRNEEASVPAAPIAAGGIRLAQTTVSIKGTALLYDLQIVRGKVSAVFCRYWKCLAAFVCLLALILCGLRLYTVFAYYESGSKEYAKAEQTMASTSVASSPTSSNIIQSSVTVPQTDSFTFDNQKLTAQNGDAIGWLRLLHTKLSYPLVQGKDNEYYLTHTFYKSSNSMGAIFLDSRIKEGLTTAKNSILYGHNMRNGSMFATLCNFQEETYYQEHPAFELYTKDRQIACEIFSVHEASPDSDTYTYSFANQKAYESYLKKITKLSLYNTGVTVLPTDHILTLSTCVNDKRDMRFVVHAKIL